MLPFLSAPAAEAAHAAGYSFASEYDGPPLPYDIPRVVPIDVDRIPLAALAPPSAALPDPLSLPVVHPLASPKKPPPLLPLPGPSASPTSVIENHAAMAGPDARALGSSGFPDLSTELSEIADVGFSDELPGAPNRLSAESPLSSGFSFRSSASVIEDAEEAVAAQAKKTLLVTFQESVQSSCSMSPATESTPVTRSEELDVKIKKGACHKCLRGSRFTEKEACLACNAKYCSGCVLEAMGSMPEGRKCVSCIGSPILESKREMLGKTSRLLKRLLSSLEVKQVLKAERNCEANQLRPDYISVNGKKLTLEEMIMLQSCPCPPPKLKPGLYWYDKVSGYWGKEGHKPDRIITPNLNIGGNLNEKASNGNTGILINGREITKAEVQMLKWAGVPCAGNPHFWLNADGTYLEEGQKNVKGQIWGKRRMKLLCPVLSLPFPSKDANCSGKAVNDLVKKAVSDYLDKKAFHKLLLIGNHGSGTSTVFKQAKFLYRSVPFSEDERQNIKLMIQTSIYSYLGSLLECREWFEEESLSEIRQNQQPQSSEYSLSPRLKTFADWLLKIIDSGNLEAIFPAAAREHAPLIEEMWNDLAIQATYDRSSEIQPLPGNASYFLERVVDISRVDYEPSDTDILYANELYPSSGVVCTDFYFPPSAGSSADDHDQQQTLLRYQLIRVPYKDLGKNCKWLDMFDDVGLVIFCVAVTEYDEYYKDSNGVVTNKMMESRRLFESVASHQIFAQIDFLLILNKFDLLEQKIEIAPLTLCEWFDDFSLMTSRRPTNRRNGRARGGIDLEATKAEQAFHYIAKKFKMLFSSLTGRKLYVTRANGLESESVDAALRYGREIVNWGEEEWSMSGSIDYSTEEQSSFSH